MMTHEMILLFLILGRSSSMLTSSRATWITVFVILWQTRRLTTWIIQSFAWSAGDMEKKGRKVESSSARSSWSLGEFVAM